MPSKTDGASLYYKWIEFGWKSVNGGILRALAMLKKLREVFKEPRQVGHIFQKIYEVQ